MQLRRARLCLDCEEIHDAQYCPTCASATFAYLTQWVPAPERRAERRSVQSITAHRARTSKTGTMVGVSVAGLGLFGLARWFAKGRRALENSAMAHRGELK